MACVNCVRLPFWLDAFSSPSRPLRIRVIQRSPSLASPCGFGAVVFGSVALAYVGSDGWMTKISSGEIISLVHDGIR
jgi:hypothetical protein